MPKRKGCFQFVVSCTVVKKMLVGSIPGKYYYLAVLLSALKWQPWTLSHKPSYE